METIYKWVNHPMCGNSKYKTFNLVMSHLQKLRDKGNTLKKSNFARMCKRIGISQTKTYSILNNLGVLTSTCGEFPAVINLEFRKAYKFNELSNSKDINSVVKGQYSLVRSLDVREEDWNGESLFFAWQTVDIEFDVYKDKQC